jgi:hypothetical protein
MGVCPAIKPKVEKRGNPGISLKPANKYPFKDSNVKLSITCTDHGGGVSGPERRKKSKSSFKGGQVMPQVKE